MFTGDGGLGGESAEWLFHEGPERWNAELGKFSEANIYFNDCDFSKESRNGIISFGNYLFPERGDVFFLNTNFGHNHVSFEGVIFGDGDVCFDNAKFGNGPVNFMRTQFGKGRTTFSNTHFGEGDVFFGEAIFGGDVSFHGAYVGEGKYDFNHASFKGHANFAYLFNSKHISRLTFRNAIFEKSFDLTNNKFTCIPDLVGTKTSSHVSLHEVECELKRVPVKPFVTMLKRATNSDDAVKLRRFKELAESNKDHAAALRFHADELRAKRWNKDQGMGYGMSFLDLLYSMTSNYGQSIGRPAVWLATISIFIGVYLMINQGLDASETVRLLVANMVPFVAISKTIIEVKYQVVSVLLLIHGLISFVFIFLIGLGFRNRFRV